MTPEILGFISAVFIVTVLIFCEPKKTFINKKPEDAK